MYARRGEGAKFQEGGDGGAFVFCRRNQAEELRGIVHQAPPSNVRLASCTPVVPSMVARIFFAPFAIPATFIVKRCCRFDPLDTGRSCVIQVT